MSKAAGWVTAAGVWVLVGLVGMLVSFRADERQEQALERSLAIRQMAHQWRMESLESPIPRINEWPIKIHAYGYVETMENAMNMGLVPESYKPSVE